MVVVPELGGGCVEAAEGCPVVDDEAGAEDVQGDENGWTISWSQVFGASYTDVNAQVPALNLLIIISLVAAVILLVNRSTRMLASSESGNKH